MVARLRSPPLFHFIFCIISIIHPFRHLDFIQHSSYITLGQPLFPLARYFTMVVSTRSAGATVREGSMSPPRDPRGPPSIPMPDGRVEGAHLPPPPPVRIGLGGPTSQRPDPPSPHSSDGRSTRAQSSFANPRRQRPGKAPEVTINDRPSTSQHQRGGRDRPQLPSIGEPYLSPADLHRIVSTILEQMEFRSHPLRAARPPSDTSSGPSAHLAMSECTTSWIDDPAHGGAPTS